MNNLRILFVVLVACIFGTACSGTCKRMEKDRAEFLERKPGNTDPHLEATIPFSLAERLIEIQVKKVKAIPIKAPGLGNMASYFGDLSVKPAGVKMQAAGDNQLGFRLIFDVLDKEKKVFSMHADVVAEPQIDLAGGKIEIGFSPETVKTVKPGLSKDAKKDLGSMIYKKIPGALRMIIPKSLVDKAAASVVKNLVTRFYEMSKDKLLPKLGQMSKLSFQLPDVPIEKLTVKSSDADGGWLRLLIVSGLPVRTGLASVEKQEENLKNGLISVRMSASTMAELVNWAMEKELIPNRYNKEGKPKKNGELRPGLDWVPGKKPMKVYLWDLEKPCMRLTMGAKADVGTKDGKIQIKAKDAKIEDIEASAFTKAGVWFYALWKDALKVTKSTKSKMKFEVAGEKMELKVEQASLENDELVLGFSIENQKEIPNVFPPPGVLPKKN